jgi:hypothetical protein
MDTLDLSIEAARAECQRTYVGPGACHLPEYLAARRAYHALLVEAGRLDPRLADYLPIPRNGHAPA